MLTRTLLRTGFRDLRRRPLPTALMVLGVAVGVAVVVAINLAIASAGRGFARSTEAVVGRATHQIRGGPRGLPEALYRRLRVEWGVRTSAPVVEGTAIGLDLDRQPLRILGVDPLAEGPFRDHLDAPSLAAGGLAQLLTRPGAVLMGANMADRYRLTLGSPLRLQVGDRLATLNVLGLITPGDEAGPQALDGLLLMDVGAAQKLLGQEGRLSHIDLRATAAEAERLLALLPPGVRLAPAHEQSDTIGQLTAAFRLNLTALSLLALVVGMFLIYNTVLFSVVQRRAVIGTLRILGATGAQVFTLILVEAATASAAGTALGLGLGWVLGQGVVRLVTRTINDLYYVLAVVDAPLTLGVVLEGVGLGLGAGLLAALAPAWEAARVEPVAALRPSTLEGQSRRLLPWVSGAGGLLVLGGAATLAALPRSLVASFAGLFGIVLGLALLAPAATVGLMRVAGPAAAALAGPLGRMAARTVTKAVSRTGVAIAALMVAVSATIGVSLMIASFRSTVQDWLDATLRADVYVGAPAAGGARNEPTLSAEVPARVAAVPGVVAVETLRSVRVASPQGEVQLTVVDSRRERGRAFYRFAEGDPAATWARLREGAVIVSEPFAYRHQIPPHGGSVVLHTDGGEHTFPVAGIYYDYATERGTVLMSRVVYERFWDDRSLSSLAVYVGEGRSADAVADALRAALAGTALQVTPNRSLRTQALKVFDRTFTVTRALRMLAVVVAFIGVWSALLAFQVERTRELATLQVLGLTPGQLWGLTLLETGFMGAAAGLLSLPTGTLLALILVDVINVRSFGWTMRLTLEPAIFVEALAVSVLAALLAAVYPLRRLQRIPLAAALRQE
jgi:putative ABC transport system permease protein